jgi:hypothetical protein
MKDPGTYVINVTVLSKAALGNCFLLSGYVP